MGGLFKLLVSAACVAVIAASGVYLHREYLLSADASAAKVAYLASLVADERQKEYDARQYRAMLDDDRLPFLDNKKCGQLATDIVWVSTMKSVRSTGDLTPDQVRDARLCLTHDLVSEPDIADIRKAGLYDMLASTN